MNETPDVAYDVIEYSLLPHLTKQVAIATAVSAGTMAGMLITLGIYGKILDRKHNKKLAQENPEE